MESCAVLTTEANGVVRPIHDRMPVILRPEDYGAWLDPGTPAPAALLPLLRPYPGDDLVAVPVGRWVNDDRHEGPERVAPAG